MTILEKLQEVCSKAAPSYHFEFETQKMMNLKADDMPFPLIFFEEYAAKDGAYSLRFGMKKTMPIELSFMKLAPRDNLNANALLREKIRNEIEEEAIIPFINALNDSHYFEQVQDFNITPEPAIFDANAVSLLLRFNVSYKVC